MARYTFDQIKIGDNIYYEDRYLSKRNLYWKVVAKLDKSILMIEPAESGDHTEKRMIDFLEARKFALLPKE